jgi:Protein of unknown function (DUF3592)
MLATTSIITRQLAGALLCLPVVLHGGYLIWKAKRMQQWLPTNGRIQKFEIVRKNFKKFNAVVEYTYSIEGKSLLGNRITVCDATLASGLLLAQKLAKQFPVGKEVQVYYDSQQPDQSVLKRPGYVFPYCIFLIGLIAMIVLVVLIGKGTTLPPEMRPHI